MIMIIVSNLRTEQCKKYLHYRIRMETDYNAFQFLLRCCCCCCVKANCPQTGPGTTGDCSAGSFNQIFLCFSCLPIKLKRDHFGPDAPFLV